MQATVTAVSDVDFTLDLHVPADELEPRLQVALKEQRAGMSLKGFRPGRVPLPLVRKMVGPQVAVRLAEETIGEAFRTEVAENEAYDVLGQPRLVELDYDPSATGDLRAVVAFGVRPRFELADTSDVMVTKFVRTITDEDVEADIERRRELAAVLTPAEEGAALTEKDVATADIQPVDADGEPTGPVQQGAEFHLASPDLRDELRALLLGKAAGETVLLELPHTHGDDEETDHEDHTDRYRLTITAVSRRVLPELDAAFIGKETAGRTEELDAFRAEIQERMTTSWERRAREAFENKLAQELLNAHPFPVPEALIESTLDAMTDEHRDRESTLLPKDFDHEAFRTGQREQAEQQVRWFLLKDRLIAEHGVEVTNEDFDAEFERMAEGTMDAALVRGYFTQQPRLLEQLGDQLLNRRLFEALAGRFTVVEKGREELERERTAREAAGE